MENVKIYYLEDEYEPKIIMLYEDNKVSYSISRLDLTEIIKIDYPSDDELNQIVRMSIKSGYDGSWGDITFILDKPEILKELITSDNREEYILSLKNEPSGVLHNREILIERFYKRFGTHTPVKYASLYDNGLKYLKSLSDNDINVLSSLVNNMTNNEYFYHIILLSNETKINVSEKYFSF